MITSAADLLSTPRPPNPYRDAVCASGEYDPEDWFRYIETPGGRPSKRMLARREEVRARCLRCPVLDRCARDYGREPYGIVAGTLPVERGFIQSPSNRPRRAPRVA